MTRPLKSSIDYFPLDIVNDDKLDLIEAKYERGFEIVIKLYRKIYGSEGYYCYWNEEKAFLFTKQFNNVNINLINDVIEDCLRWHLFDKNLHKLYGILTSKGVQRRYLEIIKRRKQQYFIHEFCLFDVNEYINSVKDNVNVKIEYINKQSKVKESKVNNNNNTFSLNGHFEPFWLSGKWVKRRKDLAEKRFIKNVKNEKDWNDIQAARDNYAKYLSDNQWLQPMIGSRWFDEWRDFIVIPESKLGTGEVEQKHVYTVADEYRSIKQTYPDLSDQEIIDELAKKFKPSVIIEFKKQLGMLKLSGKETCA